VEYDFTAALEEKLDQVSAGELNYKQLLRDFWKDFHAAVDEAGELRTSQVLDALNDALAPMIFPQRADGTDPRACPSCGAGRLSLKTSRFGAFIGCSNYPECRYTRPIATPDGEGQGDGETGDRELGLDPKSGDKVWLKAGRFGPYVQLGEGEKPRRSSLPKGWAASALDLDQALRLLSLPREVGKDPEDGQMIYAGLGRYGPYVQHDNTYASLGSVEEAFEVGLNRAVTLIAEKKAGGPRGGRGTAAALKELGEHPQTGKPVRILAGRFGPYIKHEDTNANVPRGKDPQEVTLDEAVALLAERAAKGGGKAKRPVRAKAATDKPAAKKPAAKKPAAKKKAPAKKKATAKAG
jgi:DNA topoisomerase-1